MRVLFIVPYPMAGASVRLRVHQFLPYLRAHGVETAVRPFLDAALVRAALEKRPFAVAAGLLAAAARRCWDVLGAGRWDVVVVHREALPFGPPLLERVMRWLGPRIVYDFDDAIYLHSGIYHNWWDRLKNRGKPARLASLADHVTVGNDVLRDYARAHNARVTVLPTSVDTALYRPRPAQPRGRRLVIGWIGSPASTRYLEWLVPALREAARVADVEFDFVGTSPFQVGDLPVRFRPWSLDTEVQDLERFDIGIMPLFDDPYARGKSGFKLLLYMAMGIPAVASPVGVNQQIVTDGQNGLLASDLPTWTAALCRLAGDADLRQRLGAAGRGTVEARYSLNHIAPRLLHVLDCVHRNTPVDLPCTP